MKQQNIGREVLLVKMVEQAHDKGVNVDSQKLDGSGHAPWLRGLEECIVSCRKMSRMSQERSP